jgi:glycosyltransferase involved in cell wall biosynthesis
MAEATAARAPRYDVVVPTLGRRSLRDLIAALATGPGPLPGQVVLVDDRPEPVRELRPLLAGPETLWTGDPVLETVPPSLAGRIVVVAGPAAGPAAARNHGWRSTTAPWVAFLDDDVVPSGDWRARLAEDIAAAPADLAGSQGQVRVPVPAGRRPTDWERNLEGLERARWATADLAYRRTALASVGGFDERFPRAYREDADLGLRLTRAGWRIEPGRRRTSHPVRPADALVSVRLQAGNADDVLAFALHGRGWREAAGVPAGRRPRHLAITAAGVTGVAGLLLRRRRLAAAGLGSWLAGTAELAWARIAPGPRTPAEVATMVGTSTLLPAAASLHWLGGIVRHRRLLLGRLAGRAEAA